MDLDTSLKEDLKKGRGSFLSIRYIFIIFLLVFSFSSYAGWQPLPPTEYGNKLRYNSETGQIQTLHNSKKRLMWDGIHRLMSGDIIRIKNGVAVRDSGLQNALAKNRQLDEQPDDFSACHILVRKTCGLNEACGKTKSCISSKELLDFYNLSPATQRWQDTEQCEQALADNEYFKSCPIPAAGVFASACDDLVNKSCGGKCECMDGSACKMAQQLRQMEYDERIMQRKPQQSSHTTGQCERSFGDNVLFKPCWYRQ